MSATEGELFAAVNFGDEETVGRLACERRLGVEVWLRARDLAWPRRKGRLRKVFTLIEAHLKSAVFLPPVGYTLPFAHLAEVMEANAQPGAEGRASAALGLFLQTLYPAGAVVPREVLQARTEGFAERLAGMLEAEKDRRAGDSTNRPGAPRDRRE